MDLHELYGLACFSYANRCSITEATPMSSFYNISPKVDRCPDRKVEYNKNVFFSVNCFIAYPNCLVLMCKNSHNYCY